MLNLQINMTRFAQLKSYFAYLKNAQTKYGIHSPFIYEFVTRVLKDKSTVPAFDAIEKIRKQYILDERVIEIEDFGAGSKKNKSNNRKIFRIARYSLMPKRYAQLLYRIIKYYNCKNSIELGTSLGITSAYLAMAQPEGKLITIEGSRYIADIAINNTFKQLNINNIDLHIGRFDDLLPEILKKQSYAFDFVLIDGNHRYEPVLKYYNLLLEKSHNNTIFVFDDINWNKEMQQAWVDIKKHSASVVSIDLYYAGIIFLKKELSKQDFVIWF